LFQFVAPRQTVQTRNRNTQVNIDQSYKATEKSNIECAIAAIQTHRPTNRQRRLCGLGQSTVLSTHRYFINRHSSAPIAETAAALMLSLKTVQRIVCRSVATTNIMLCRAEQKLNTNVTDGMLSDYHKDMNAETFEV
jgi:hypothetical protein